MFSKSRERESRFELDLEAYTEDIQEIYEQKDSDEFYVLDMGCGEAHYHDTVENFLKNMLEEAEVKVVGVDKNYQKLLESDTEIVYSDFLEEYESGSGIKGLPFQEDSFDMIISNHLMCQIDSDEGENVLEESRRVLNNDDLMIHGPETLRHKN